MSGICVEKIGSVQIFLKEDGTYERLNDLLTYEESTGIFFWRKTTSARVRVGNIAGHLNKSGYITIRIDKKLDYAHRLAFKIRGYTIGNRQQVDHINGNRSDNSFKNLRLVSNGQNSMNSKISKNNTTGIKGVSFLIKENKFLSQLVVNGEQKYIGLFPSLDLAKIAIENARILYHKGFVNHG
jgi:hypothetical protein